MKVAFKYVRFRNEFLEAEKEICEMFNFIKKAVIYDSVKEKNLYKEFHYQQLKFKIEILFFLIKESNLLANLDSFLNDKEESVENLIIFNSKELKNKIDYNRSIIKEIIFLLNNLMISVSINHKLEPNEYLSKTVDSIKSILKLTDEGFLKLTREIDECQESEDGLMAILILDFVDKFIYCLTTIDNIKKNEDGENKKTKLGIFLECSCF